MREIKFRAWDKDAEKMTISMTVQEIIRAAHPFLKIQEKELVWMQFTGLRDKNGVDIYEGDITNNGIIRFGKEGESIGFYLEDLDLCNRGGKKHRDTHCLLGYTTPFEIIGNIYENPEILEKES